MLSISTLHSQTKTKIIVTRSKMTLLLTKMNYGGRRDFRRQTYDDKREKSNYQSGLGNEMDGVTTMTKPTKINNESSSENSENRFLCNPTVKNVMSNGWSQTARKKM